MSKKYAYKPGRWTPSIPAQKLGEVLQKITDDNGGRLTPPAIIEASRPRSAPLHPQFEWNDKKAAEEYRQHQAREMVNVVMLVPIEDTGAAAEPVRAFVSLIDDEGTAYRPIEVAIMEPESRDQLLRRCLSRLTSIKAEFDALSEFSNLWNSIEQLELEFTKA